MVSKEQLDNHVVDEQQKYILQPTRMDYRLILKSLGVVTHSQVAKQLIDTVDEATYLIADKGYDAEYIRIYAKNKNMIPIIPLRSKDKRSNKEFDKYLYKLRHLVENAFCEI